jgi:hypothetical protein
LDEADEKLKETINVAPEAPDASKEALL